MKRRLLIWIVMVLAVLLPGSYTAAEAAEDAEWTVLIYLCGSDLETHDGMASFNLREIMAAAQPESTVREIGHAFETVPVLPEINVVIETGGTKQWQDLSIASDRLQRYVLSHERGEDGLYPLVLRQELPAASMGNPDTLADFIRWGTENYPAEKTMLVLWDHGNGSLGMIVDECFGNDTLYLDELDAALAAAGARFELILLDACMMASLETAQTLAPYASWMAASEEMVSGYGTAFRLWLESLFQNPTCNGDFLGTIICDLTESKYADMEDDHAALQLTWSVIELNEIEHVSRAIDALITFLCDMYEYAPERLPGCLTALAEKADRFGTCMVDLNSALESSKTAAHIDRDLLNELDTALDDAVQYSVNGLLHSNACGLSFCMPVNLTAEQLDAFARACRSAPYMALVEALTPGWKAPADRTERSLPPVEDMPYLSAVPELIFEDGAPKVRGSCEEMALWQCSYELYRIEEDGRMTRLGVDPAVLTEAGDTYEYTMHNPYSWPAVDGVVCDIEYVSQFGDTLLYDIPVQIGSRQLNLRTGYMPDGEYKVYGISSGYNTTVGAPTRTVQPLALMQGQEYRLLYPVADTVHREYTAGPTATLYRTVVVKEIPLPPGDYACVFVMKSCYLRTVRTDPVRFTWDGTSMISAEQK